jgi:hypothetical protein
MVERIDYRGSQRNVTLSRDSARLRRQRPEKANPELSSRWAEILTEHLSTSSRATSKDAWKYKQRLVGQFSLESFWDTVPGTIRITIKGEEKLVFLDEIKSVPLITSITNPAHRRTRPSKEKSQQARHESDPTWDNDVPTLSHDDIACLSDEHRDVIFKTRAPVSVRWLASGHLATDWKSCTENQAFFVVSQDRRLHVVALPNASTIGISVHKTTNSVYGQCFLNANNSFIQWLIALKTACKNKTYGLNEEHLARLISLLDSPVRYRGHEVERLKQYIDGWKELPGLPAELLPPDMELSRGMFSLTEDESGWYLPFD